VTTSNIARCTTGTVCEVDNQLTTGAVERLKALSHSMEALAKTIAERAHQALINAAANSDGESFWRDEELSNGKTRHCARAVEVGIRATNGSRDALIDQLVKVTRERFKGGHYYATAWLDERMPKLLEGFIKNDLEARGYEVLEVAVDAEESRAYKGGRIYQWPGVSAQAVVRDPKIYLAYLEEKGLTRAEDNATFWQKLFGTY